MFRKKEEKERAHYGPYLVFVCMFAALGSVSFGYSAAVIGTTLGQPSFISYMGLDTAPNAASLIGAMNGLFFAGGVFGSALHGWLSHRYGRKMSIAVGCILIIVSGACLTGAVNISMFIAFRFFNGLGAFQLLAGVPLYIAEIVSPKHRGVLSDIHAVGLNVGYAGSGYIGLGFFFTDFAQAWRPPMGIQMAPPLILVLGLYWIPESPRWLLAQGRAEEAWAIVARLHRSRSDTTTEFAEREFYQMKVQIDFESRMDTSYTEIFRRPSFRKRAIMTIFLTFVVTSSGVLVINNYGALLYSSLGYDARDTLLLQTGWTATALVFNAVAMLFVDRVRRNWLISIGFFMLMCVQICNTALQKHFLGSTNKGGLGAAAAMLYLYIIFFSLFLDGPLYFYVAEIWPTHLRAKGYALGMGALSLANMIWLLAAPTAFVTIGWTFYIFFICFSALGCIVSLTWFPNTLHKPLEEIATLFGDHDLVKVYQEQIAAEQLGPHGHTENSLKEKSQTDEEEHIEAVKAETARVS